jgi:hypothetical protein
MPRSGKEPHKLKAQPESKAMLVILGEMAKSMSMQNKMLSVLLKSKSVEKLQGEGVVTPVKAPSARGQRSPVSVAEKLNTTGIALTKMIRMVISFTQFTSSLHYFIRICFI